MVSRFIGSGELPVLRFSTHSSAEAYCSWQDAGLPAPHWVCVNLRNGHAHLGYQLATPVARTSAARQKTLRYLAAIEHVLARRLGADMAYAGLITKNPIHHDWWTIWHSAEPYSLDYLAEFCPDKDLAAYSRRSRKEASGFGRNVTLFDNVREWAYSAVREYWRPNGYDAWAKTVRATCDSANAFGLEQGGGLPPQRSPGNGQEHCPLGMAALYPSRVPGRTGRQRGQGGQGI